MVQVYDLKLPRASAMQLREIRDRFCLRAVELGPDDHVALRNVRVPVFKTACNNRADGAAEH